MIFPYTAVAQRRSDRAGKPGYNHPIPSVLLPESFRLSG